MTYIRTNLCFPLAMLLLLNGGCDKISGKSPSDDTDGSVDPIGSMGSVKGPATESDKGSSSCLSAESVPEIPAAAGQLTFKVPPDIDPCTVSGFVVGYRDDLKVHSASDGTYFINHVPPGKHDVIIEAGALAVGLVTAETKTRAIRLDSMEFLAGVRKEKSTLEIPLVGGISGKVTLAGQSDNSGIHVYIPGTGYDATTDNDGHYTIAPFVPSGVSNLFLEKDGYHRGQIEKLTVESGSITKAPDIELLVSTGAEGQIVIAGSASIFNSRTVNLSIAATEDAVLMKISEKENFEGASWRPLVTTIGYTFNTPGPKKLYVMFANLNGLQSSPFSSEILIDIFSDGISAFTPAFSVSDVLPPSSTFEVTGITVPANATAMLLSDQADFSGAEWQTPSATAQLKYAQSYNNCGTKHFYIKFRDRDGFESPVGQKTANLQCWKNITKLNAPTRRERHSAVWTGNQMIIWGGTTTTSDSLDDGAAYNPKNDSWLGITATNAPAARFSHSAVWTGTKMIVWGGNLGGGWSTNTGAIYDPATDSWTPISTIGAPSARSAHSAIWTGNRMIVFGGISSQRFADGGIYDPASDTWSSLPVSGGPEARYQHAGVWTGTEMLIWGGVGDAPAYVNNYAFDPLAGTWRQILSAPDDQKRQFFSYTWDGNSLQIWGGITTSWQDTGVRFDLAKNSWSSAPFQLSWKPAYQSIVATGKSLLFWGGTEDQKGVNNDGYILNVFE